MVGIRHFKLVLGIFIFISCVFLMSHNVFADSTERVQNRSVRTVQFNYSNSETGAQVMQIQNGIQGPIISTTVNAQSLSPVYIQKINLNNTISMSKDTTLVIPITLRVFGTDTVYTNDPFDTLSNFKCPIAEYVNMFVNSCDVKSVETHFIQDELVIDGTVTNSANNGTIFADSPFDYLYYTQYVININLKTRSESSFSQDYIRFVDSPILQLVNNHSSFPRDIAFQIVFNDFIYLYVDNDAAADAINERNQKEYAAVDNIDNQSESDISDSSSTQTTSLLGTVSSFVSAFSNIRPSSNCNVLLEFPDYMGGNQTVNICQGKDKAPAIVSIGSSLLLIITFVPLAFIMLRMIYNEIRSFTNG